MYPDVQSASSARCQKLDSATMRSPTAHLAFPATPISNLNPLESALTQVFILKDFIPFRIRRYEKTVGVSGCAMHLSTRETQAALAFTVEQL